MILQVSILIRGSPSKKGVIYSTIAPTDYATVLWQQRAHKCLKASIISRKFIFIFHTVSTRLFTQVFLAVNNNVAAAATVADLINEYPCKLALASSGIRIHTNEYTCICMLYIYMYVCRCMHAPTSFILLTTR